MSDRSSARPKVTTNSMVFNEDRSPVSASGHEKEEEEENDDVGAATTAATNDGPTDIATVRVDD
jgi:hypothetical protein